MPVSAATPGWFHWQGMWAASLQGFDGEIQRRPYHRYCGCALHRSRTIPADAACPSSSSVSYPIRRRSSSWHSLASSSSSTNLTATSAEASPRISLDGNVSTGDNASVVFTIDSSYHA